MKKISTLMEQMKNVDVRIDQRKKKGMDDNNIPIIFAISLKSKKVSKKWDVVQQNLAKTIRSILNNTYDNYRIIIAGHEKPDIEELLHKKVVWIPVTFSPPSNPQEFTRDKMRKRLVIGKYLKNEGFSGYFMALDADDWIHYRFIEYINSFPLTKAFVINKGIMINQYKQKIWILNNFYRNCGSCAIFYFTNDEFPRRNGDAKKFTILNLRIHPKVKLYLRKLNIPFQHIDEPLVLRYFGHGDNNMELKRTLSRRVSSSKYNSKEEIFRPWVYSFFKVNS
ncbi:glycosyltransferase family A protein [Sutcliffiella halmapala]